MRSALAKFGMEAAYVQDARLARSEGYDWHWVVEVITTDGHAQSVECDDADAIAAALDEMGLDGEARLVKKAASMARAKNRPTPWSLGP